MAKWKHDGVACAEMLARCREALRAIDFLHLCPYCTWIRGQGHAFDCQIDALLRDLSLVAEPLRCEDGYHNYGIGGFCHDCGRDRGRVRRA